MDSCHYLVSWYINTYWLFKTKSCFYIYTYIYIYMYVCMIVGNILNWVRAHLFVKWCQVLLFQHICLSVTTTSTFKIKKSWALICHKNNLKNMVRTIIQMLEHDMTSQLIGSDFFNFLSNPVRAKVECWRSHNDFGCKATDCLATRVPSSSIKNRH